MNNPIFDYNNSNLIYPTAGNIGLDLNGDFHMRVNDNISLNLQSGEFHLNSGWKDNKEDENQ